TGQPHKPTEICKKKFSKGDIITGEIKTVKGKPSFVLHKGVMVIPFSCVKQIVVKDIQTSNIGGEIAQVNPAVKVTTVKTTSQKKQMLMDGVIVGSILGFAGVIIAEKQGMFTVINPKNKIYGAIAGAVIGAYYIYRFKK
ncbi:MAG TPA: hypothetical protein PLN38_04745, partial [Chitinophagales bacterium]|nr:hypothetical protein [Chitinophagales bacterium]